MQKFGFNIHALNLDNTQKFDLLNLLREQRPTTALVLNNAGFASQVADIVPNTILRMTKNDDNVHLKTKSFAEWWNLVKANYTDKRLIVHWCNEPHTDFGKLSLYAVEGITTLINQGHRGIFGNFSVGTPEIIDWQTTLKPMLDLLSRYPDQMFLGLHEYMMYSPELCIPYEINRYSQIPQNISIIMTEFGFDFIQDVFNHYPDSKIRGWKDHRDYLIAHNISNPEPTLVSMLKNIFAQFYNSDPKVIGTCFFSYGDSGGWESYDASSWEYLHEHLGEFQTMAQIITQVTPTDVTIAPIGTGSNRRTQPNVTSEVKGTLAVATDVIKIAVTDDNWTQYQFSDGNYWLRNDVVKTVVKPSISIVLYDAPPDDVAKIKDLLMQLQIMFEKYQVEFQ